MAATNTDPDHNPTPGTPEGDPPADPVTKPVEDPTIPYFTEAQMNARIAKEKDNARAEERKKLYDQMKAEKERISALESEIETLKKAPKDDSKPKKEDQQQIEALRADLAKANAAVESLTGKFEETLTTVLAKQHDEFQSALAEERREAELKVFKTELLAENPDCVPDLVIGDTREELEAAMGRAKQVYADIRAKALAGVATTQPGVDGAATQPVSKPGADPNVVPPANKNGSADTVVPLSDLRKMSRTDYKARIEQIKNDTFANVGLSRRAQG